MPLGARQAALTAALLGALGARQAVAMAGLLAAARRRAAQQAGRRAFQRAKGAAESMNVRS